MSTTLGFLIRDGLAIDIPDCLALDHLYRTDYVWQMSIAEESGGWRIGFKTERLPRPMEIDYPSDEGRLQSVLPAEHCFLVAISRDQSEIMGYLAMRNNPVYAVAQVHDLVVSRPYRGKHIATRLLNVARQWARERHLVRLTIEVQTKNHPGILFCQQSGLEFCGFNDQYFPNQDIAVFFSQSLR
jgi:GNAT superfamily N-acetyltransferase